jgi:hypothetical protein
MSWLGQCAKGVLRMGTATQAESGVEDANFLLLPDRSFHPSILLEPGPIQQDGIVKVVQTFRSGTNDIDAIDVR